MATWNPANFVLTNTGDEILAKVIAGIGAITVTKVVSGGGYTTPSALKLLTDVNTPKQVLEQTNLSTGANTSTLTVRLSNAELTAGYTLYQLGVYVTHPDYTGEQLYMIAQTDQNGADQIPAPNVNTVTLNYSLYVQHQGTTAISFEVTEADVVTTEVFEAYQEEIEAGKANTVHTHDTSALVSGVLPLARGGTSVTTTAALRSILGLGNTTGPIPVASGGTNATDAAGARTNLGVPPISHASTGSTYGGSTNLLYGHAKAGSTAPMPVAEIGSSGTSFDTFAPIDHTHSLIRSIIVSGDLNTYVSTGHYHCQTATIAASLTNCPVSYPFHLLVGKTGTASVFQMLFESPTSTGIVPKVYYRSSVSTLTVWSGWARLYLSNDVTFSITGNAGSATKLQTPRNLVITGAAFSNSSFTVPFDGTANGTFTIPNLNATAINAGTLSVAYGGTGVGSMNALRTALNLGTATNVPVPVTSGGTGVTDLSALRNAMGLGNSTGVPLPVYNGGTGQSSLGAFRESLGLGNSTSTLGVTFGGTGVTSYNALRSALNLGSATTSAIPVASGGTGVTTYNALRNALGLGNSTGSPLPITSGGTGQTSRGAAMDALANGGISVASGNIQFTNAAEQKLTFIGGSTSSTLGFYGGSSTDEIRLGMYDWSGSGLVWSYDVNNNFVFSKPVYFNAGFNVGQASMGILQPAFGGTGRNDGKVSNLANGRAFYMVGGATSHAVWFDGGQDIGMTVSGLNMSYANDGILPIERGGTSRQDGKAQALANPRSLAWWGAATGATFFDGSGDVGIQLHSLDLNYGSQGTLAAAFGGTGQGSLQATRNAMGLGNTLGVLPIANGGTGAGDSYWAWINIAVYGGLIYSSGTPTYVEGKIWLKPI